MSTFIRLANRIRVSPAFSGIRNNFVYKQSRSLFRLNPFVYGITRDSVEPSEDFFSYLSVLQGEMGEKYKPAVADVESTYNKGTDTLIINFKTRDSKVNIFSTDLMTKLAKIIKSKEYENVLKIVIRSGNPNSFIHRDDVEFISQIPIKQAMGSYTNTVQEFLNIFNYDELRDKIVLEISAPCMDTGLDLALSVGNVICINYSGTYFGYNQLSHYGYTPPASGIFNLACKAPLSIALGMAVSGHPISARQATRYKIVRDNIEANRFIYSPYKEFHYRKIQSKLKDSFISHKVVANNLMASYGITVSYDTAAVTEALQHKHRNRHTQIASILSLMMIPYTFSSWWSLFRQTCTFKGIDMKIVRHLIEIFLKYPNNDFKKHKVFKDSLHLLEYTLKDKRLEKIRKFGMHEIEQQKQLPNYSIQYGDLITIYGSGQYASQMIYNYKIYGATCFFTCVCANEKEDMDIKKTLFNLCKYNPHALDSYATAFSIDTLTPPNMADRRKMDLLETVKFSRNLNALNQSELIIEASTENVEEKRKNLSDIEACSPANTPVIVTTSSVTMSDIVKQAQNPRRFIGINFGLPLDRSCYFEVVQSDNISEKFITFAMSSIFFPNKQIVLVKDSPGFFATRVLFAALDEYLRALENGKWLRLLDKKLIQMEFSHVFSIVLDKMGIDTAFQIAKNLSSLYKFHTKPLEFLIQRNALGVKSGRGLYEYKSSVPNYEMNSLLNLSSEFSAYPTKMSVPKCTEACERILARIVNESIKCLEEKVVADPYSVDVGAVYGVGFPKSLSGPCQYVDDITPSVFIEKLNHYRNETGSDAFCPSALLKKMSEKNEKFYN